MDKTKKALTASALILLLIVGIARVGQNVLRVENHVLEPSREYVTTTSPKTEVLTESERLVKQRITSGIYIKNGSLLTQAEIDKLKGLSAIERGRLLSYYRAFLDPNTPDLKPLIVEMHNGSVSLETLDQFDHWISETF